MSKMTNFGKVPKHTFTTYFYETKFGKVANIVLLQVNILYMQSPLKCISFLLELFQSLGQKFKILCVKLNYEPLTYSVNKPTIVPL